MTKVESSWGNIITAQQIAEALRTVTKPKLVAIVHAETSTGALTPVTTPDAAAVEETIIHYQGADELFNHGGLKNPEKPRTR